MLLFIFKFQGSGSEASSTTRSGVMSEKSSTRKCIIANIIESETAFLGGLGALYQVWFNLQFLYTNVVNYEIFCST